MKVPAGLSRQGEGKPEDVFQIGRAIHANDSAVRLDGQFTKREAKAAAVLPLFPFHLGKFIEDGGTVLGGNSRAMIDDGNPGDIFRLSDGYFHRVIGAGEFKGIGHQIRENAADHLGIAGGKNGGGGIQGEQSVAFDRIK